MPDRYFCSWIGLTAMSVAYPPGCRSCRWCRGYLGSLRRSFFAAFVLFHDEDRAGRLRAVAEQRGADHPYHDRPAAPVDRGHLGLLRPAADQRPPDQRPQLVGRQPDVQAEEALPDD